MEKPQLAAFDAPKKSASDIRDEIKQSDSKNVKVLAVIDTPFAWGFCTVLVFLFSYAATNGELAPAILSGAFGGLILWGGLYFIVPKDNYNNSSKDLYEALKKREAYETALRLWEEKSSFSGKQFWLKLRGEKLEMEFQNLVQLMGWDSWLTPVSGDGGVDVICENKKQARTLLVQCKGHAKPVGVATIRDAVGVASLYEGEMIVVSPIGFTKGSYNLAKQSRVRLLSATNLVNIATKKEKL